MVESATFQVAFTLPRREPSPPSAVFSIRMQRSTGIWRIYLPMFQALEVAVSVSMKVKPAPSSAPNISAPVSLRRRDVTRPETAEIVTAIRSFSSV